MISVQFGNSSGAHTKRATKTVSEPVLLLLLHAGDVPRPPPPPRWQRAGGGGALLSPVGEGGNCAVMISPPDDLPQSKDAYTRGQGVKDDNSRSKLFYGGPLHVWDEGERAQERNSGENIRLNKAKTRGQQRGGLSGARAALIFSLIFGLGFPFSVAKVHRHRHRTLVFQFP